MINTAQIHSLINSAFDDPGLDAFCQSYFYDVYNTFGRGMRKDEKITLLLDHLLRLPTGFDKLLNAVRSEYEISGEQRDELKPLIEALEALPRAEDGHLILNGDAFHSPLPEFDPNVLDYVDAPKGAVELRSKFYIKRRADDILKHEVVQEGTTTTIREPPQVGNSSLLTLGIHNVHQNSEDYLGGLRFYVTTRSNSIRSDSNSSCREASASHSLLMASNNILKPSDTRRQ